MCVHHDVVFCSLFHHTLVVVVHELAVVVLAARYDVAHVAGLHGVVAVFVHQLEGILKMTFVVDGRCRRLVVHHQLHALGVGIVVEILYVEVGVWCDKVEDVELLMAEPVLPSYVPSFHEHLLQTVLCSKVDVSLHLRRGGAVGAVRLALGVVGLAQSDGRIVVGVAPALSAHDHVPPHATVFCRMNP